LRTGVANFMKDLGNYSAARTLSIDELKRTAWQKAGHDLYKTLFAESRLDLANTKELVIVPDDVLWYVPFEALVPEAGERPPVLSQIAPIRYGPTAVLVMDDDQPPRRPQHTAIVGAELNQDQAITGGQDLLAELDKVVSGPLRLTVPLPTPGYLLAPLLDSLIVLDDVSMERAPVAGWAPLPRSPAGGADTLEAWMALPFGGPQRVVVTSFITDAEQGLKATRRANAGAPGSEVFQTVCRFMANGARTILLTRWRTSGRTNFDLVREFAQEWPRETAADAWRRAVVLTREAPLDISREPRLKRSDDKTELPTADHPFFWAGYLLVDTGTRPGHDSEPAAPDPGASGSQQKATPTLPPPGTPPQPGGMKGGENEAKDKKPEKAVDKVNKDSAKSAEKTPSK
jgi:hypothetical protein